jgi:hypothetical protein
VGRKNRTANSWSTGSSGTYKPTRGQGLSHQGKINKAKRAKKSQTGRQTGQFRENPVTPENRKRPDTPICGAKRTGRSWAGPGVCCQPAGWGTNHLGYGKCKLHGGGLPSHVTQATQEKILVEAMTNPSVNTLYGSPKEIGPHEALLAEIHRTSGHVEWLQSHISALEGPAELRQHSDLGVQPSVWITMYQQERQHLVRVCKAAIDAGVAERHVRVAEQQGALIAQALQAFIQSPELELNPAQLLIAPKLLRKVFSSLALPAPEQQVEPVEIIDAESWEDT